MSTYVLGHCNTGWFPEFFTRTENQELLDEYCDLQELQASDDAVPAYELITDEHQLDGLRYVSEEALDGFVQYLREQFDFSHTNGYCF